jgi:hypothetical protein
VFNIQAQSVSASLIENQPPTRQADFWRGTGFDADVEIEVRAVGWRDWNRGHRASIKPGTPGKFTPPNFALPGKMVGERMARTAQFWPA